MIDLYSIITLVFGLLAFYLSGYQAGWLAVIGAGVGSLIGIGYMIAVGEGTLFLVLVYNAAHRLWYGVKE